MCASVKARSMDHGGIILLESDEEMDEDDILEIADAVRAVFINMIVFSF